MKKSQVTVFIVIGIIIITFLIVTLYLRSYLSIEGGPPDKVTQKTVKTYVEECLSQVASGLIDEIGENGGTLTLQKFSYYKGDRYNFLCYDEPGVSGCVNSLLLRKDIEEELGEGIRSRLAGCLDLSSYEDKGFYIEIGPMEVSPKIGKESVIFLLRYPLSFLRGEDKVWVNEYYAEIKKPLGRLYELSLHIINEEGKGSPFDPLDYLNTGIKIEKHRLYPHTYYSLNEEGYFFNFAIEGKDTSARPGAFLLPLQLGCCYIENSCFQSVSQDECELVLGTYASGCSCTSPNLQEKPCRDCEDCGDRKHGESWCVYESQAGDGYDYVGSMHYVRSCNDGKVYTEECRDYREELCTEEDVEGKNRAVCRVNRWEDCLNCDDRACCEDREYRDCEWKDWIKTEERCVPEVPPGFKHWEGIGSDICIQGSEAKECEGLSCPNIWVDDAARLCHMIGDCGNYRNVADRLTDLGYFNTDPSDKVRIYDFDYYREGWPKRAEEFSLDLGIDNTKEARISTDTYQAMGGLMTKMLASIYQYLDRIDSLNIGDILNPFTDNPKIAILDFAVCGLWLSPEGGSDCGLCEGFLSCTEYKCKSLGERCVFENDFGRTRCFEEEGNDRTPPKVSVHLKSPGYSVEKDSLRIYNRRFEGFKVSPDLKPYSFFSLSINTTEETRCILRYGPDDRLIKIPTFPVESLGYMREHNITLRVPPRMVLPKRISDLLNITRITEIENILGEPEKVARELKERYRDEIELASFASGKDVEALIDKYVEKILKKIELIKDLMPYYRDLVKAILAKFDEGGYYFFIECTDRSGNRNIEEVYLDIVIDDNKDDKNPPVVLGGNPKNNSMLPFDSALEELTIYLNEPGECSWKSGSGEGSFNCTKSQWDISPFFGGSYRCRARIPTDAEGMDLTLRCNDNPFIEKRYLLRTILGERIGTVGERSGQLTNVTPPNAIHAGSSMIDERLAFLVASREVDLNFYMDKEEFCTINISNSSASFDSVGPNDNLIIGQYRYRKAVSLPLSRPLYREEIFGLVVGNATNTTGVIAEVTNITISLDEVLKRDIKVNPGMEFILDKKGVYSCNTSCSILDNNTYCRGWFFQNMTVSCIELDTNHTPKMTEEHNISIVCRSKNVSRRNMMETSYIVGRSAPIQIIEKYPLGEIDGLDEEIRIITTKNPLARCGIASSPTSVYIDMTRVAENEFVFRLPLLEEGQYRYYVRCFDAYRNSVEDTLEFAVI